MLSVQTKSVNTLQDQYKQARRAEDRFYQLAAVEEQKALLCEAILQDIQSGELNESFALDAFERKWRDRLDGNTDQRKPDEMRLPIYRDKSLAVVVLSIFDDNLDREQASAISIDELVRVIYSAKTKEEVNACKSSLTAVLNRCVNSDELKRVKPGVFARNVEKRLKQLYKEGGLALV